MGEQAMNELANCPFCSSPHPVSPIFQNRNNFPLSRSFLIQPRDFIPSKIADVEAQFSLKENMEKQSLRIAELSSEVNDIANLLQEKYLDLEFAKKDSELNRLALRDLAVTFIEVGNEITQN